MVKKRLKIGKSNEVFEELEKNKKVLLAILRLIDVFGEERDKFKDIFLDKERFRTDTSVGKEIDILEGKTHDITEIKGRAEIDKKLNLIIILSEVRTWEIDYSRLDDYIAYILGLKERVDNNKLMKRIYGEDAIKQLARYRKYLLYLGRLLNLIHIGEKEKDWSHFFEFVKNLKEEEKTIRVHFGDPETAKEIAEAKDEHGRPLGKSPEGWKKKISDIIAEKQSSENIGTVIKEAQRVLEGIFSEALERRKKKLLKEKKKAEKLVKEKENEAVRPMARFFIAMEGIDKISDTIVDEFEKVPNRERLDKEVDWLSKSYESMNRDILSAIQERRPHRITPEYLEGTKRIAVDIAHLKVQDDTVTLSAAKDANTMLKLQKNAMTHVKPIARKIREFRIVLKELRDKFGFKEEAITPVREGPLKQERTAA